MVERVDEWEGRCAIECSSIVEGSRDAHRCLVDIGDAEINFSHDGVGSAQSR
jgi:hypothetical protein